MTPEKRTLIEAQLSEQGLRAVTAIGERAPVALPVGSSEAVVEVPAPVQSTDWPQTFLLALA